jgi:hypothetical protein
MIPFFFLSLSEPFYIRLGRHNATPFARFRLPKAWAVLENQAPSAYMM